MSLHKEGFRTDLFTNAKDSNWDAIMTQSKNKEADRPIEYQVQELMRFLSGP